MNLHPSTLSSTGLRSGRSCHLIAASGKALWTFALCLSLLAVRAPRLPVTEPLRAVCEAFRDAIVTGAAPLTDGACGARVLEAGSRSLARRGAPVPIGQVAA